MKNDKYWRKRAVEFEQEWQARCQSTLERELAQYFSEALKEIADDIAALYGRFASENGLTMAETRRLIRGDEFKTWRMSLQEYLALSHTSSKILRELNTLAARSRISRLEKLYSETLQELQKLGEKSESAVKDFLTTAYKERYYHGIYDLAGVGKLEIPVSKVEPSRLEKVLVQRWQGGNYSSRIWKNTEKLSQVLKRTILEGVHRGLSIQKISKALNAEMQAGYKNAERLVRTEMNFVQNYAAKESLESAGLREYEFIATLDHQTSQRCRNLDGTVHLLEEFDPGTNAPPMHPRCRSTISAVISEGTRTARVKGKSIRVPADMTYGDYKKVYVDKTLTLKDWQDRKRVPPIAQETPQKTANNKQTWSLDTVDSPTKLSQKILVASQSGQKVVTKSVGGTQTQAASANTDSAPKVVTTASTPNGGLSFDEARALFQKHDMSKISKMSKSMLHSEPYAVTEVTARKGGVTRNFYDGDGRQYLQISNNDHGNVAESKYGNHGEHAHDYVYDAEGKLISRKSRELRDYEIEGNKDIL